MFTTHPWKAERDAFTHSMLSMKILTMHLVRDKAKVRANVGWMMPVVLETFFLNYRLNGKEESRIDCYL